MKKYFLLIVLGIFSLPTFAQEAAAQVVKEKSWLDMPPSWVITISVLLAVLVVLSIATLAITIDMGRFARKTLKSDGKPIPGIINLFGIFDGEFQSVTGRNADELLDEHHDYDGIQEFDNDLPPWWVWGFYVTIFIAVVYLLNYHVFHWSPLQAEEYENEIKEAELLYANVDIQYDGPETDQALLDEANALFVTNCAACHGKLGEGGAGPNLTDEFWLHGGNINDIYTTIKYGVEEKGMKAWKNSFSNEDIYRIASYIQSIKGSNPPNAKPPQGDKYEE